MTRPSSEPSFEEVVDLQVDDLTVLLQRTASGCNISFQRLYVCSNVRLLRVVLRINADRSEAQETLQDIYLKIWNQSRQYDARRGPALHWLFGIARHAAIDSLRWRNSRPQRALPQNGDWDDDDYAGLVSAVGDPLEDLITQRRIAAVECCLRALPPESRDCLTLAFFTGMSHEAIADHLQRPLGTVKSLVRRSLHGLREQLGDFR